MANRPIHEHSTEKQGKHLTESLKKYGVVEPIVWNKRTGYIVGGHFRVRQLQAMGVTEVPCVVLDLNDEDERELNIRLNANTGSFNGIGMIWLMNGTTNS